MMQVWTREDDDRRSRHENADRMHGDDGWMRDWMRMPEQIGLERRRYLGLRWVDGRGR